MNSSSYIPGSDCKFKLHETARAEWVGSERCIRLVFEDDSRGKFYMRGAVAWPEGMQRGFSIVAGQHIDTGVIIIFSQYPFSSIEREFTSAGLEVGFAMTSATHWRRFGCQYYFFGGDKKNELHRRNVLSLSRYKLIKDKPRLIHVPFAEREELVDTMIFEFIRRGNLRLAKGTPLHKAVEAYQRGTINQDDLDSTRPLGQRDYSGNTIRCLRVLIAGFYTYPYHKPTIDQLSRHNLTKEEIIAGKW